MAELESTVAETKTIERLHRSTLKLLDDIDDLNETYFSEAKKKNPSPVRLTALSHAIEVAQSSQVRLNFSILRFRDGLHPKPAPLIDKSSHKTESLTISEGRLPDGVYDALRKHVDGLKPSNRVADFKDIGQGDGGTAS